MAVKEEEEAKESSGEHGELYFSPLFRLVVVLARAVDDGRTVQLVAGTISKNDESKS